jgi:argininosuccinate lyase
MEARSQAGFIAAPELVEQMVQEWKIPFRQAKGAVEKAIRYAEKEGFKVLPLPLLQKASQEEGLKIKMTESFAQRAQKKYDLISRRDAAGGPSPRSLNCSISTMQQTLQEFHRWLRQKATEQSRAKIKLARMEQALKL